MNIRNRKTNAPHNVTLQHLSIYYTWNNMINIINELKILNLKKIPLIHVYINRINSRLVFKIKDVCKLELQMSEKKKFFGRTKK